MPKETTQGCLYQLKGRASVKLSAIVLIPAITFVFLWLVVADDVLNPQNHQNLVESHDNIHFMEKVFADLSTWTSGPLSTKSRELGSVGWHNWMTHLENALKHLKDNLPSGLDLEVVRSTGRGNQVFFDGDVSVLDGYYNLSARLCSGTCGSTKPIQAFSAHGDSHFTGYGAADDVVYHFAMHRYLEELIERGRNSSLSFLDEKDLLFAFLGVEEWGLVGSTTLLSDYEHSYRITSMLNLEAMGHFGRLYLTQVHAGSQEWVKSIVRDARVHRNKFVRGTSLLQDMFYGLGIVPNGSDTSTYSGVRMAACELVFLEDSRVYHTVYDSYDFVSDYQYTNRGRGKLHRLAILNLHDVLDAASVSSASLVPTVKDLGGHNIETMKEHRLGISYNPATFYENPFGGMTVYSSSRANVFEILATLLTIVCSLHYWLFTNGKSSKRKCSLRCRAWLAARRVVYSLPALIILTVILTFLINSTELSFYVDSEHGFTAICAATLLTSFISSTWFVDRAGICMKTVEDNESEKENSNDETCSAHIRLFRAIQSTLLAWMIFFTFVHLSLFVFLKMTVMYLFRWGCLGLALLYVINSLLNAIVRRWKLNSVTLGLKLSLWTAAIIGAIFAFYIVLILPLRTTIFVSLVGFEMTAREAAFPILAIGLPIFLCSLFLIPILQTARLAFLVTANSIYIECSGDTSDLFFGLRIIVRDQERLIHRIRKSTGDTTLSTSLLTNENSSVEYHAMSEGDSISPVPFEKNHRKTVGVFTHSFSAIILSVLLIFLFVVFWLIVVFQNWNPLSEHHGIVVTPFHAYYHSSTLAKLYNMDKSDPFEIMGVGVDAPRGNILQYISEKWGWKSAKGRFITATGSVEQARTGAYTRLSKTTGELDISKKTNVTVTFKAKDGDATKTLAFVSAQPQITEGRWRLHIRSPYPFRESTLTPSHCYDSAVVSTDAQAAIMNVYCHTLAKNLPNMLQAKESADESGTYTLSVSAITAVNYQDSPRTYNLSFELDVPFSTKFSAEKPLNVITETRFFEKTATYESWEQSHLSKADWIWPYGRYAASGPALVVVEE